MKIFNLNSEGFYFIFQKKKYLKYLISFLFDIRFFPFDMYMCLNFNWNLSKKLILIKIYEFQWNFTNFNCISKNYNCKCWFFKICKTWHFHLNNFLFQLIYFHLIFEKIIFGDRNILFTIRKFSFYFFLISFLVYKIVLKAINGQFNSIIVKVHFKIPLNIYIF